MSTLARHRPFEINASGFSDVQEVGAELKKKS